MSNRRKARRPRSKPGKPGAVRGGMPPNVEEAVFAALSEEIAERSERAHPELPRLAWSLERNPEGTPESFGRVSLACDEEEVRNIVTRYARALNGSGPIEVSRGEGVDAVREIWTAAIVEDMKTYVCGVLGRPEASTP